MLNNETRSFDDFSQVERDIDNIKTLAELSKKADFEKDRDLLRQSFLANLDHVECKKTGEFQIFLSESSPNCVGWWR